MKIPDSGTVAIKLGKKRTTFTQSFSVWKSFLAHFVDSSAVLSTFKSFKVLYKTYF